MSRLILAVGTAGFLLEAAELSEHPDSLLSSLVSSCTIEAHTVSEDLTSPNHNVNSSCWSAVEGGWRLHLEAMELPIKDQLEVLDLTTAARLLHAIYTLDTIPQGFWGPLLNKCPPSATAVEQSKHDGVIFAEVSKLLDFFNMPGPVTKWLPTAQTLSLAHWRLLAFSRTCHSLHIAREVVDTMMNYKPYHNSGLPAHTAVFVVHVDPMYHNSSPFSGVTIRVLHTLEPSIVDCIGHHSNRELNSRSCGKIIKAIHCSGLGAASPCTTAYVLSREGEPDAGRTSGMKPWVHLYLSVGPSRLWRAQPIALARSSCRLCKMKYRIQG